MNRSEAGSAWLDTILFGILLLVPLIVMLGALADLHRAALTAAAAAREGGFAAARAADPVQAARSADEAIAAAFEDSGLPGARVTAEVAGLDSFERGAAVEVRVAFPVRVLPIPFVAAESQPVVTVRASHSARIDPYRSR